MTPEQIPLVARHALEFVSNGAVVGLGTGRASTGFVHALAERVRQGLRVRGVPTSEATGALARQLGIPIVLLDEAVPIDVCVDGADEVDPRLDLIKGKGGALVREKIVAASARQFIVLVGPEQIEEKLVPVLGTRGSLPVEVVPFGMALCRQRLNDLGLPSAPRTLAGGIYTTDNGNHILDCSITPLPHPAQLEEAIRAIPGVVGTGLFLGMADIVLIQRGESVERRRRLA